MDPSWARGSKNMKDQKEETYDQNGFQFVSNEEKQKGKGTDRN